MKKIIYLIRHSIKENKYGKFENLDSEQMKDEKKVLSCDGEKLAFKLAQMEELKDIDELWSSNYVRAIQTAKYISHNNNIELNISDAFDERHYGEFKSKTNKEKFWIEQFKDENLKNKNGESQLEVRNRLNNKINSILRNSNGNKIAIVTHNACILFYLLKYCKLINAQVPKKLTIGYKDKIIINNSIMRSPSIIKLEFENNILANITYFEI